MTHWLLQDHLVYFFRGVVGQTDLSTIYASYDGSKGEYPAYHPKMMVALLPHTRLFQNVYDGYVAFELLMNLPLLNVLKL